MHNLYRVVNYLAYLYFKVLYRHKIIWAGKPYEGGAILAANHTSYYDPPILSSSWPYQVHFLAADYLFKVPLFGSFIRAVNAHPLKRGSGDLAALKLMVGLLKEGHPVIMFPEGRRSSTGELQELKSGIAMIAERSGAPVIPIYIHGLASIWPRHKTFPRLWGRTWLVVGNPIWFPTGPISDKKIAYAQFTQEVQEAILALKEHLKAQIEG